MRTVYGTLSIAARQLRTARTSPHLADRNRRSAGAPSSVWKPRSISCFRSRIARGLEKALTSYDCCISASLGDAHRAHTPEQYATLPVLRVEKYAYKLNHGGPMRQQRCTILF